jgi:hypothetical protein
MKDFRASNHKAPGLAPRMLIVYRAVDTIIRCWETLTGGSAGQAGVRSGPSGGSTTP